jgi:phage-related protein
MANRHVSVATAIEINRIASDVAIVTCMEIDIIDPDTLGLVETLRLVANNESLTYQGQVYTAANFEFSIKQEAGSAPDITVTAQDYSQEIQVRMQAYGGGVGFTVRLMEVNTGNLSQAPEIQETMKVIGASAKDYAVTFTLGAENPLTMRFPRRRQRRDRCPWVFRSAECGYTGGLTTCDFTLQGANGCAAHNNTTEFGGFPGIQNRS